MRRGGRLVELLVRTVNTGVSALLTNPWTGHWIGKGITTVSYAGRRSGRTFSTPVAYRRDGDQVTILADLPDVKNWWRNFTGDGGPVTLRLDGTYRTGHAVARRTGPAGRPLPSRSIRLPRGDSAAARR